MDAERAAACLHWEHETHRIATLMHEQRERLLSCREDFLLAHEQGDHALAGAAIDAGLAYMQEWHRLMRARQRVLHMWSTIFREGKEDAPLSLASPPDNDSAKRIEYVRVERHEGRRKIVVLFPHGGERHDAPPVASEVPSLNGLTADIRRIPCRVGNPHAG